MVTLVNFDEENKNKEFFEVYAWNVKTLKPVAVKNAVINFDKLHQIMNTYFEHIKDKFHELIEVQFVGVNDFVVLKYVEKKERSLPEM